MSCWVDIDTVSLKSIRLQGIAADGKLVEYAAAFFLLADSAKDAVSICIERLGDLQLGIAIARVYEGDDGPILRELLEEHILPQASAEGNRWLATWAFWMLNRRDMAVRALIVSRSISPCLRV